VVQHPLLALRDWSAFPLPFPLAPPFESLPPQTQSGQCGLPKAGQVCSRRGQTVSCQVSVRCQVVTRPRVVHPSSQCYPSLKSSIPSRGLRAECRYGYVYKHLVLLAGFGGEGSRVRGHPRTCHTASPVSGRPRGSGVDHKGWSACGNGRTAIHAASPDSGRPRVIRG
jgi:hypothetical protein